MRRSLTPKVTPQATVVTVPPHCAVRLRLTVAILLSSSEARLGRGGAASD